MTDECKSKVLITIQSTTNSGLKKIIDKDGRIDKTRDIPNLPPEIIDHILYWLLKEYQNCDGQSHCNISKFDSEYELLNLFIVFPHLLPKIKLKLCPYDIPICIYNFMYLKIDNLYEIFTYLVDTLHDMYSLDMWLSFITCEHSPFYYTDDGVDLVYYILNKYSNHQRKKISNYLLCNILRNTIITKSIDNIIFNKLVYHFKNTSKYKLSILTNNEKAILLSFSSINIYTPGFRSYGFSECIIEILSMHSTKLLDILAENNKFDNLCNNLVYILDCYIVDSINCIYDSDYDYLLQLTIEYYLSKVLYSKNNTYLSIISLILEKAIIKKNYNAITFIFGLRESTNTQIQILIQNFLLKELRNKNSDNYTFLFDYMDMDIYMCRSTYRFTFTDLSIFEWNHTNYYTESYIYLYQKAITNTHNTHNIHNLDKNLLYKIYNYMVYNYNHVNMNLIFDKSYTFENINLELENKIDYHNSISDKLHSLHMKNDIDTLCKYISKVITLCKKCSSIFIIMDVKCHSTLNFNKKQFHRKVKYIHNIYNFVYKYKLYNYVKLNNIIRVKTINILDEILDYKFNNLENIADYTAKSKHTKIIQSTINLEKFILNFLVILNKNM